MPYINFDGLYKQLGKFVEELEGLDEEPVITVGVGSSGPGSEYSLVWEWGNVRQTKQGPKTVLGTNPDGSRVWLSIQAPFGYVRINVPKFWQIVYEEMDKVKFNKSGREVNRQIKTAMNRVGDRCLAILQESVPVDKGQLRDSLKVFTQAEMND